MLSIMKMKYYVLPILLFLLFSCNDENAVPGPTPTGQSKSYTINPVVDPTISGSIKFIENSDNSTTIEVSMTTTSENDTHPAHLHFNSAAETGGIALTLTPVAGSTGTSSTTVTQLDNGTLLSYTDFLNFDGHLNVHVSEEDLESLIGQADIGTNELTGDTKSYMLNSVDITEITGTATFAKRKSGETLATISLENTPQGGVHSAHIHSNTVIEEGAIIFTLNPVNGDTGLSITHIAEDDNGAPLLFDDILALDAHIKAHLSADELQTIVFAEDIGQNELTGESKMYELSEIQSSGVSGSVSLFERMNSSTLITITVSGTPPSGDHPAHIHDNDVLTGGGVAISLNNVDGSTGKSYTQVDQLNAGTKITYSELLAYNGHVNVHLSQNELTTIVAQGDIGSNTGEGTVIEYDVTSSGSSAYIFNGNGFSDASNPMLNLKKGTTYVFKINAPGHPFFINSTQGTGTGMAFANGVTNNGTEVGNITFVVPNDAPGNLFYNCQFHASMSNSIIITN